MAAASFQPSPLDRPTVVQKIRDVFGRSPVFREAHISDPLPSPENGVSVEVRFGGAPALFRIVAPSPEKAYAVLYELASSMVQAKESRRLRPCRLGEEEASRVAKTGGKDRPGEPGAGAVEAGGTLTRPSVGTSAGHRDLIPSSSFDNPAPVQSRGDGTGVREMEEEQRDV